MAWNYCSRKAINDLAETEIERETDPTLPLAVVVQEQQNNLRHVRCDLAFRKTELRKCDIAAVKIFRYELWENADRDAIEEELSVSNDHSMLSRGRIRLVADFCQASYGKRIIRKLHRALWRFRILLVEKASFVEQRTGRKLPIYKRTAYRSERRGIVRSGVNVPELLVMQDSQSLLFGGVNKLA